MAIYLSTKTDRNSITARTDKSLRPEFTCAGHQLPTIMSESVGNTFPHTQKGGCMDILYKIERFEEDYAVCIATDERTVNIPFEEIPADSVAGDLLKYFEGTYRKAE